MSQNVPRSYRIRLALFNEIKILTRLSKSKYVVKLIDFEHNTVSTRRFQDFGADSSFPPLQDGENTLYLLLEKGECDLSHILTRLQIDERMTPSKLRFYWEQESAAKSCRK